MKHERPRAVPRRVRERDPNSETNSRRKRRFGDPKDTGLPGRGAGASSLLAAPRPPVICFLYPDLVDASELATPAAVFGQYPRRLISQLLPLLRCERRDILHVCSGSLPRGEGIRVDLRPEARPDILADGRHLPFADGSVAAVLIDPPYTEHYARDLYGVDYPRPSHLLREAARVVRPCGRIGFVHYLVPNPPPQLQGGAGVRAVHRVRVPDARGDDLRARAGRVGAPSAPQRRRCAVSDRTASLKEVRRAARAEASDPELPALLAEAEELRPHTRAGCVDGPRPCPWLSCRYHLGINATSAGGLQVRDPETLRESCALDVADRDGVTLEEVGGIMGVTRERIRQIERAALRRLNSALLTETPRAE